MSNEETSLAALPAPPAEIQCESLPVFDRADLTCVRRAFRSAVLLPFRQAWLPKVQADFSPGIVRLGWRENSLMIFAELTDKDIFNRATEFNQPLWELGDVFEMFFKSDEMERYVEFQVSPQNQRLQLLHPHACKPEWSRQRGEFTKCLLWNEVFHSQTWVDAETNRWQVYAEIPAVTVCGPDQSISHAPWRFSFGRYDYTCGIAEPVISSTSPHAKPDFHRQQEWDVMTFKNSLVILDR
jgi:hypothetical protein